MNSTDFKQVWDTVGTQVMDNAALLDRLTQAQLLQSLARVTAIMPNIGRVGLGIVCTDRPAFETLNAVVSLQDQGIVTQAARNTDSTNNREFLVKEYINAGFERLLLLDGDAVLDAKGFNRLMDTMDRQKVAMVAGITPVRNGKGLAAWEDLSEDSNNLVQLTRENIPRSGIPFEVAWCGLSVALLDLDQIKKIPAPRFKSKSEGEVNWASDEEFCRALKKHDLSFVVDPQVRTILMGTMGYGFSWTPEQG